MFYVLYTSVLLLNYKVFRLGTGHDICKAPISFKSFVVWGSCWLKMNECSEDIREVKVYKK